MENGWHEYKRLILRQLDELDRRIRDIEEDLTQKITNVEGVVDQSLGELNERIQDIVRDVRLVRSNISKYEELMEEQKDEQKQKFQLKKLEIRKSNALKVAIVSSLLGAFLTLLVQYIIRLL